MTSSKGSLAGGAAVAACGCALWLSLPLHGAGVQTTGAIQGLVTVDEIPEPVFIDVTADQATCGDRVEDRAAVVDPSGGVANAIISIPGLAWTEDPPAPVINNKECYFEPRVQVAKTRSVVSIQSEDTALHTTHAYDDRARTMFNIAIPVPGMDIKRPLRRPGVVRVECDSHGWMRGWVLVTDDVATVTASNGRFEITGVPPGTYELTIWHERFEGSPQTVTVTAGGVTDVTFALQ